MKSDLASRRVYLIGGSGGVGKTTVAASLAVRFAREGYSTIVLTVDPARRLAQALGLESFSGDIHEVKLDKGGPLFASQLDTRRYFDRIIEKFATSQKQREKILNNRLYRVMVNHLGGTHEYAAMERLLEFASDAKYQKIIVDTPPTQNALDLLTAPQRLADFMDNSVLRWFQGGKPIYMTVFKTGSKLVLKVLKTVFGNEFIQALAEFMDDLEGMQAGFRKRNLEVLELLRSKETAFCLVTVPTEVRVLEAGAFQKALQENDISLAAAIINRVEPDWGAPPENQSALPSDVRAIIQFYQTLKQEQAPWLRALESAFRNISVYRLQKQFGPMHDLASLSQLASHLLK